MAISSRGTSRVLLVDSTDRRASIRVLFEQDGGLAPSVLSGKNVVVKANFSSADPFPASTHLDTLRAIMTEIKQAGAARITLAERSGMGDTCDNLERLGVYALSHEMDFDLIVLDEELKERWLRIERGGTHWLKGFYIAKVLLEADVVVQTCCAKTHRYGGHFTMSLKNSVGRIAKRVPGGVYDYMAELHMSPCA